MGATTIRSLDASRAIRSRRRRLGLGAQASRVSIHLRRRAEIVPSRRRSCALFVLDVPSRNVDNPSGIFLPRFTTGATLCYDACMGKQEKKTRRDVAEIALSVVEETIGEKLAGRPKPEPGDEPVSDTRNPAAMALSKLGASKGGQSAGFKANCGSPEGVR